MVHAKMSVGHNINKDYHSQRRYNMEKNTFWRIALVLTLVAVFSITATPFAMEKPNGFPNRPMTMIVPYGAGGGSDQLARAMATALEKVVGVPVKVVNKPGGSGVAGLSDFFMARPDGYTITEHIDDAATLYASGVIKENPSEDWYPACIAQIAFSQIYVRPDDKRFPDWDAFVKYAKENPGKIKLANVANVGSMERVVTSPLTSPQKGTGPLLAVMWMPCSNNPETFGPIWNLMI